MLDRCRIIRVPSPAPEHLDRLLPALLGENVYGVGLDERWIEPLLPDERVMVAAHWKGGSIRNLQRLIQAVLDARERCSRIH